ncbi:hypothetical protein [Arthrobacter sp. UYCu723]
MSKDIRAQVNSIVPWGGGVNTVEVTLLVTTEGAEALAGQDTVTINVKES